MGFVHLFKAVICEVIATKTTISDVPIQQCLVCLTCSTHFFLSTGSLENLYRATSSLGMLEQPAATHLLGIS